MVAFVFTLTITFEEMSNMQWQSKEVEIIVLYEVQKSYVTSLRQSGEWGVSRENETGNDESGEGSKKNSVPLLSYTIEMLESTAMRGREGEKRKEMFSFFSSIKSPLSQP